MPYYFQAPNGQVGKCDTYEEWLAAIEHGASSTEEGFQPAPTSPASSASTRRRPNKRQAKAISSDDPRRLATAYGWARAQWYSLELKQTPDDTRKHLADLVAKDRARLDQIDTVYKAFVQQLIDKKQIAATSQNEAYDELRRLFKNDFKRYEALVAKFGKRK